MEVRVLKVLSSLSKPCYGGMGGSLSTRRGLFKRVREGPQKSPCFGLKNGIVLGPNPLILQRRLKHGKVCKHGPISPFKLAVARSTYRAPEPRDLIWTPRSNGPKSQLKCPKKPVVEHFNSPENWKTGYLDSLTLTAVIVL